MEQYPRTPEEMAEKARVNRAMFDAIARRYDLMNGMISLGLDRRWRRRLVEQCVVTAGDRCLDLCCGTGAVTRLLARTGAEVIGIDASEEMLTIARQRAQSAITFQQGDALRLPFPDEVFDAVTIAFGNRNVAGLDRLYAEMRRVARPGGRVASLEITAPANPVMSALFFSYLRTVPPTIAWLLDIDPAAYRYLADSVRRYPGPTEVAAIMRQAGLREVSFEQYLASAIVMHRGIA